MSLESVFRLSLIMNMVDHLTGPMASVQSSVDGSVSRLQSAGSAFGDMTKIGTTMATVGEEITSALLSPVEATFDTRRAIGELASLGVKDLETIETAAGRFSDTWAGTTKADFITAAYDIKSGIASLSEEGIAGYTELSGVTALATKATVDEMTSLFATGYGIYKGYYDDLSDLEFAEMFSAGIADSVRAFKTSGTGMADGISRLGAAATNAQVPLEEQLAILGTLQATMSGSEAGTKYSGFIRSAVKGGEELGLSFMDANNQLLSLPEILDQLHGKFGDTIDAAEKMELQKAFGDIQAVQFIDLLYDKTGELEDSILGLYSSMGEGKAVAERMAQAINQTEPAQYEVLKQQIQNTKEAIGETLLPTVNQLLGMGSVYLGKARGWIENNRELVAIFMKVALAVGLGLTVLGTLIGVIGGVGLIITKTIGTFGMLKPVFLLAKGALAPLIGSVWSFTAALLANPITWIVIGVVALIAVIVLLYNKCEGFRNAVNSIFSAVKGGATAAIEVIKGIAGAVMNVFSTIGNFFGNIKNTFVQNGGGIKGAAAVVMEGVKGAFGIGFNAIDSLTGGKLTELKNKFTEKFNGIKNTVSSFMSAANNTASEKLGNMQTAYETHGGGIKGIAAASMEGVKGVFDIGFSAIDGLTGGKLSDIKSKFTENMDGVRSTVSSYMGLAKDALSEKLGNMKAAYEVHGGGIRGVVGVYTEGIKGLYSAQFSYIDGLTGGKLSEIRNKFSEGIQNMISAVTEKFTQFRESGRKLIETFTEGIKGAMSAPVEAVRGGLSKIREMLPFSDAKTGPLSTLTLSGQRMMTTFAEGIIKSGAAPSDAAEEGLRKIDAGREPVKKVSVRETFSEKRSEEKTTSERNGGIFIERLLLNVDLKSIKDLQLLQKLIREIEDYAVSNGIEPAPEGA